MDLVTKNIINGFANIRKSIFSDPSIFWFLTPIFLFWLILEIYFSKYKKEKLGWNTALGNGLSIFWLLIICLRHLFENRMENFSWGRFIALILILCYVVFIIFNSFTHKLKESISFLLAAPTLVYYLSAVTILWTFGGLEITFWVTIDLILIYIVILLIDLILRKLIKGKEQSINGLDISLLDNNSVDLNKRQKF